MLEIKQLTRLQIIKYCEKLEQENKKLKESLDIATKCSSKEEDWIIRLSEENKNLKSELSKFRDSFKKYRDYEKEELAESCYDLARENESLRAEVRDLVERNIELDKKYTFVLSKLRR